MNFCLAASCRRKKILERKFLFHLFLCLFVFWLFISILLDFGEVFDAMACKGTCDYCREPAKVTKAVNQAKVSGGNFYSRPSSSNFYRYFQSIILFYLFSHFYLFVCL